MTSQGRFVDTLPPPKEKTTIEVIVLGLSRTGTMSMYNALPKLGYKSYHMSEAGMNASKGSLILWNEAITGKYGPSPSMNNEFPPHNNSKPSPYTPSDFAKLLDGYTATSDIPTVLFLPELMAVYPNARLILTTHPRGVDAWLRSVRNSFFRIGNWAIWDWLLIPYDKGFGRPYMTLLRRVVEIWTNNTPWPIARDFDAMEPILRAKYAEHIETMRRLAREQGRELLEFDPREGWGPLCTFLGKEVPGEGYPHVNEGEYVVNLHKYIICMRLRDKFVLPIGTVLGALAVATGAWWWMRR